MMNPYLALQFLTDLDHDNLTPLLKLNYFWYDDRNSDQIGQNIVVPLRARGFILAFFQDTDKAIHLSTILHNKTSHLNINCVMTPVKRMCCSPSTRSIGRLPEEVLQVNEVLRA